jgi:hypothetical protein
MSRTITWPETVAIILVAAKRVLLRLLLVALAISAGATAAHADDEADREALRLELENLVHTRPGTTSGT